MSAPRFIHDTITTPTIGEVARLLAAELPHISARGITILVGQMILETGNFKACHCWNLGNVKSRPGDGRSWTFYLCDENLPLRDAQAQRAAYPDLILFRGNPFVRDGVTLQNVWIKPNHPYSRFRAFDSLADAVRDHVAVLELPRYRQALECVQAGDPAAAARAFAVGGYYTGNVELYIAGLVRESTRAVGALSGRPTLQLGAHGKHVEEWQRAIGIEPTGEYDSAPLRLTQEWQRARKLDHDGVVGPMSWGTMILETGEEIRIDGAAT